MEAFVFVMAVLFAVVVVALIRDQGKRRRDALAMLAECLGGRVDDGRAAASGSFQGVATTVSYATRGAGSSSESWTHVECRLPRGYPLALHLRRQGWRDAGAVARGEVVDLDCGDPRFDDEFVVEGAPAEVVRRLMTPWVRAYLYGQSQVDLETDGATLRLGVRGWLETRDEAVNALTCATALAGGVRDVSAALDDAIPAASTASPYRPMVDDAPVRSARQARADEVRALEARRDARRQQQGAVLGVWLALGVVLVVLVLGR